MHALILSYHVLYCAIVSCHVCSVMSCLSQPHSNHSNRLRHHVVIAPTPIFHYVFLCLILTYHTFTSIAATLSAINCFQASLQPQLQLLDEPHKDLKEREQVRNGAQTLGSVARLAVTSLVALCDALDSMRHSTALADIPKPLSVQCDVTLSLLLQRSTVARSLLLHSSTSQESRGLGYKVLKRCVDVVRDVAARVNAPHTQTPVSISSSSSKVSKSSASISQRKTHPPYVPAPSHPPSSSSSPPSSSPSSSSFSLSPVPSPASTALALTSMQGALSSLKGKQKSSAKTVAFGASSPTLREPSIPTPAHVEDLTTPYTVRLDHSNEADISGSRRRSDGLQSTRAGTITKPVTTDRWRAKTRGYAHREMTGRMDPKGPGVNAQMLVTGAGSASPLHSTEMTAAQRLAVWSALLVLQSCLTGCEETQRLTADFGLHEPLSALLKLSSNWASIISLLSSTPSPSFSSSYSLKRKNLQPTPWCPSQFHIISVALAASCAFTSSSSSSINSSGSNSVEDGRGTQRYVVPIHCSCVYHMHLCPFPSSIVLNKSPPFCI